MTTTEFGVMILFLTAFVLGVRATVGLWQKAVESNPRLKEPRAELVLRSFVVVAVVVTVAAGYFGVLLIRRLFGLDPIEGITPVSMLVVGCVVLIPQFLLSVVQRIADAGTEEVRVARAEGHIEGEQHERDRQAGES